MAQLHDDSGNAPCDPIAVIGLACHFPLAPDYQTFWQNLRAGRDCMVQLSDEELAEAGVDRSVSSQPDYVRSIGAIDGEANFDAEFFGISERDAILMDPQHRHLIQCAWTALEDAGYAAGCREQAIGVFVSAAPPTYYLNCLMDNPALARANDLFELLSGNDRDYLATRISYKLDLRGPSMTVQSGCSSSLLAVHLGSASLLSGECDIALAGGVAIRCPQRTGALYKQGGLIARDGRCRAFSRDADGMGVGNGLGVVVLRRLEDALRDNDSIRAVILGSAVNNDGAAKMGFIAPSIGGQREVILQALDNAAIDPSTIGYVEAHGTGIPLSDAMEIEALSSAFRQFTDAVGYCGIGSVDTNIGHLDTASGMAGLIKVIVAMQHRELPPSLNFKGPHPALSLQGSPFYVTDRLRHWSAIQERRRAAVNSFGVGGTNVHVILEEAPRRQNRMVPRQSQLILLSARSQTALDEKAEQLAAQLRSTDLELQDVAYTLACGRQPMPIRRAFIARDAKELRSVAALRGIEPMHGEVAQRRATWLHFPPTGASPILASQMGRLFPSIGEQFADHVAALFARDPSSEVLAQIILAKALLAAGIRPAATSGAGRGAWAAAAVAGALSLEVVLARVRGTGGGGPWRSGALPVYVLSAGRWAPLDSYRALDLAESAAFSCERASTEVHEDRLIAHIGAGAWRPGAISLAGAAETCSGDARATILAMLGAIWVAGGEVDPAAIYDSERCWRVPLPTHPFRQTSYWITADGSHHSREDGG